jgi:DNA-damage-inducible protein J
MPNTLSHPLKVTEIRSRIEPDLKENATRILASCGLNVSEAVRLFLHQVVAQNVTRAAMQEADSGSLPHFATVQELFDDLEKVGKE